MTVTNEGLNDINNTALTGGAQRTWYIGLIDADTYTGKYAADTAAAHNGWAESQDYSESVRQAWSPDASAEQVVTNSTAVAFSINATANIIGAFLISDNTKGGSGGKLLSTFLFDEGTIEAVNGDSIEVTLTVSSTL